MPASVHPLTSMCTQASNDGNRAVTSNVWSCVSVRPAFAKVSRSVSGSPSRNGARNASAAGASNNRCSKFIMAA